MFKKDFFMGLATYLVIAIIIAPELAKSKMKLFDKVLTENQWKYIILGIVIIFMLIYDFIKKNKN